MVKHQIFNHTSDLGAWPDLTVSLKKVKLPQDGADEATKTQWVQNHLRVYGYTACPTTGKFDRATENAIKAFQRHFYPEENPTKVLGQADPATIERLASLVDRYVPAEEYNKYVGA
ncbi:MAG: peptidoglycan-binding domain-containing protein [Bacteroidota bacterium]